MIYGPPAKFWLGAQTTNIINEINISQQLTPFYDFGSQDPRNRGGITTPYTQPSMKTDRICYEYRLATILVEAFNKEVYKTR